MPFEVVHKNRFQDKEVRSRASCGLSCRARTECDLQLRRCP